MMRTVVSRVAGLCAILALSPIAHATPAALRGQKTPGRTLLSSSDLSAMAMKAATTIQAPRGARVDELQVSTHVSLAAPPRKCALELAEIPTARREHMTLPATILLYVDESVVRVSASAKVSIPPDAVPPDVRKGAPLSLHLTDGAIEITASAVAASDGDVGHVIPVLLRPNGRAARGRLVSTTRADWVTAQ